jgi:serine/threonine protein kinase
MDRARWYRIEELFHAALTRPEAERIAFLDEACVGDADLRREIESLLAPHDSDAPLETGAAVGAAARLITVASSRPTIVGRQLGPYEIVAQIGAGGMGGVYRARDHRLDRDVALKILPDLFLSDPDRVARFEREAKVLASLNHLNIAQIHGLEESGGLRALVMELIEGPTLADRIAQGPIPVNEALPVAKQIADALEAAHGKGIIHRDLKPANIKLTPDGTVKVLDFGLAKTVARDAVGPDLTQAPMGTIGGRTRDGMLLGTVAYMSPEQARGQPVDKRTDIWAFGCVLFEMLTGHVAFSGETISDTIAAVLDREPDWTRLPVATPTYLHRLLRRCLEKDPKRRLHDIADARIELEDAAVSPTQATRRGTPTLSNPRVAWTLLVSAVLALVALAALYFQRQVPEPVVTRTDIVTPPTTDAFSFALSPDGRQVAFVANGEKGSQLWLRPLDEGTATPLAGTEGATSPF